MSTLYPEQAGQHFGTDDVSRPQIRRITLADLRDCLALGWQDFKAVPSHAIMLCVIYPVIGLLVARLALSNSVLPLLFPLAAGFALVGPFAALGLYELSRRREVGEEASAWNAFDVFRSPAIGAILGLGFALMVLFLIWLGVAQAIYISTFGYEAAADIPHFVSRVLTTPDGWRLILLGCGAGFVFALITLCISVVSFPMMLDRNAGLTDAVTTSIRAMIRNPVPMAAWGIIVAALLALGSIPFLLGLTVTMPLLGHATWHLYRKLIVPGTSRPPLRPVKPKRFAADFPLSLFQWRGGDKR